MLRRVHWPILGVLAAVTVAFLPALQAEFNWDDNAYVQTNPFIRIGSIDDVASVFTVFVVANYHPLTILSLALDYRLGADAPFVYHLTNLILHLLNVALVYLLVGRLAGNARAAWIAALLFGIHPLRVEAVAWISSRKELLYALFYFLSLLFYWLHARRERLTPAYYLSLGAFVLSLLSKATAVSLPLVLPLMDWLAGRRVTARGLFEKLPFLLLSVVFGVVAVWAQQSSGAMAEVVVRPFPDRLALAVLALGHYLSKLLLPVRLSAIYPDPAHAGVAPPPLWLVLPLLVVLGAFVLGSLTRTRKVAFGALFFLASIVFVLQLLPVGGAMAADRYTYVASAGLCYLVGEACVRLSKRRLPAAAVTALVVAVATLLGVATWQRSGLWQNRITLFTDVIEKYPRFARAYAIRGEERSRRGDAAGALADLDEALRLQPDSVLNRVNRGIVKAGIGDRRGAMRDYDRALELDPHSALAHYNRGYLLGELGDIRGAIDEMTETLRWDPTIVEAYINRGDAYVWLGDYDRAIADYDRALARNPSDAELVRRLRANALARKAAATNPR